MTVCRNARLEKYSCIFFSANLFVPTFRHEFC